MKKQVTFAQNRTEHKLLKHRFSLPTESKLVSKDEDFSEQTIYRRFSTPSDRRATVQIPRSMATAPFLKHSGLTPAQREYLYSVASSHSGDRVRDIISTHYMNILHRCIRAGHTVENESEHMWAPVTLPQMVEPPQTNAAAQNKASKHKGKTGAAARNYGKTTLPKINKRQPRRVKTPVSKQRKKLATPPKPKMKSPTHLSHLIPVRPLTPDDDDDDDLEAWLKDWEEDEVKAGSEWREKDGVSDGLSSLSLTDWDSLSDSDS